MYHAPAKPDFDAAATSRKKELPPLIWRGGKRRKKEKKPMSLYKLQKKENNSAICALNYLTNAHSSRVKNESDVPLKKKMSKSEKAMRRKERLRMLKKEIQQADSLHNKNLGLLNSKQPIAKLQRIDKDKNIQKWLWNSNPTQPRNSFDAMIPNNESFGFFKRRFTFAFATATDYTNRMVRRPISTAFRRISKSLPNIRADKST